MIRSMILAVSLLSADGSLEQSGWKLVKEWAEDSIEVKDGVAKLELAKAPTHQGIRYERTLPTYECGEMSFEVMLDGGCMAVNDLNFWIAIGKLSIFFRGDSLQRYFRHFNEEKGNMSSVMGKGRFRSGEWTKVKVKWNNKLGQIKYYVGDMKIPVGIDLEEGGPAVFQRYEVGDGEETIARIHNYGHMNLSTQYLRNWEYRELGGANDGGGKLERTGALIFRGPNAEKWPIAAWTKDFKAEELAYFDLEFTGSAIFPKNQIKATGVPDDELIESAKRIIFVDFPLTYSTVPENVQQMIVEAVKGCAELLVTSGPFGLEKCGNLDSPIVKILPVKIKSQWKTPDMKGVVKKDFGQGRVMVVKKN